MDICHVFGHSVLLGSVPSLCIYPFQECFIHPQMERPTPTSPEIRAQEMRFFFSPLGIDNLRFPARKESHVDPVERCQLSKATMIQSGCYELRALPCHVEPYLICVTSPSDARDAMNCSCNLILDFPFRTSWNPLCQTIAILMEVDFLSCHLQTFSLHLKCPFFPLC